MDEDDDHVDDFRTSDGEENNDDMDAGDSEMGFVGRLEPDAEDTISLMLLQQINGVGRSYVREHRQACRTLISEIYSPPRITKEIQVGRWKHFAPGFAMDLTTIDKDDGRPWDFTQKDKREKARRIVNETKPFLLIGPPACRAYSTWQALHKVRSGCSEKYERARIDA